LLFRVISIIADDVDTIISVTPSNTVVAPESSFTVNISCVPGQPIKGYELKLSFDPSLLQADVVSEGDIFAGYSTFFNNGTINNTAGTIIDIYGLILGSGNVSSPGTLISISFTGKLLSGTSSLNLYDVGISNESAYVSLVINNGTATVDGTSPVIVDNSPIGGYTGDLFTFNMSVTDNTCSSDNLSVWVDWSHGAKGSNQSMLHVSGDFFERSVTLDLNSTSNLTYYVYAVDLYGNSVTTTVTSVSVQDNDPPQLTGVSAVPGLQEVGGVVNISASASDNIAISEVYLNITYPDTSVDNISITANNSGSVYYCNKTYSQLGLYTYFIFAKDTSNLHSNSSGHSFLIGDATLPEISNVGRLSASPLDTDPTFGWVNITSDISDNVAISHVSLNITTPSGSFNNVSMNDGAIPEYYYNSSTAFSQYGNFTYVIWANDSSGNVNTSQQTMFSMPPNWDIDMNGECKVFDLLLISNRYGDTGNLGWIREDVDNNGEIQLLDLVLVSNHYNASWWT
jgi:hypothetical protein